MKELLKYLKNYRLESVLGPLFKLLEASFELMVPLVMTRVIDVGIKNANQPYLLKMGGFLVLLGVVGMACSVTAQYFAAKAAAGFGTLLRKDLFAHINRFSYEELDSIGTAALMNSITGDAAQVQSGVNLFLRLFLRSPFVVFGAVAMAYTINAKAGGVFAVTVAVLSGVVFGVLFLGIPFYKQVQKQLEQVLLTVRENLKGVRVIRAFHRQEEEIRRFREENSRLVKLQLFVGTISSLMNPLTYLLLNLAVILLLLAGAGEVEQGVITQGEVVALVNYLSQILVELVKLAGLIMAISKALASAQRIAGLLKRKPGMEILGEGVSKEQSPSPASQAFAVEFKQVSFTYQGAAEPALRSISFQVGKGETIGIIGGTGSGKTTLINLIPRFYDSTQGRVTIAGKNIKEYPPEALRANIGIVPQKAVLFKGSLRENLEWGKAGASEEELYKALSIAQAEDFVREKGDGLSLPVLAGGKNFSGGQKQRLCIARALVRRPEILIMDDSFSALDFATEARLRKALREETGEMTVFLVSQRISTVQNADRIVVLHDGEVAGIGSHRQLLDSCELYREICESQFS